MTGCRWHKEQRPICAGQRYSNQHQHGREESSMLFIHEDGFQWISDMDLTASHIIHSKSPLAVAATPSPRLSGRDWIALSCPGLIIIGPMTSPSTWWLVVLCAHGISSGFHTRHRFCSEYQYLRKIDFLLISNPSNRHRDCRMESVFDIYSQAWNGIDPG